MLLPFDYTRKGLARFILVTIGFNVATFRASAHRDLHERIEALSRKIQTNSANAELWLQRADLHRQHGEFIPATTDTAEAARLKPDWPAAMLERARIYSETEQFSAAIDSATACLQLDKANPDALVIRARCRVKLGQVAEAVEDYNVVLAPTNGPRPLPDLYLERARAQITLGRFTAAVRGLDEGLARLGQTPSLALPALEYEQQGGDWEAALLRVERVRPFLTPESFHATRGEILCRLNRPTEAKNEFLAGLTVIENYSPARRSRPPTGELEARLRANLRQTDLPQTVRTDPPYAK